MLMRAPSFSVTCVGTLSLGIAASTAVFTLGNAVLLKPLPFRDADRLVVVGRESSKADRIEPALAPADFIDLRDKVASFETMAAHIGITRTLSSGRMPEVVTGYAVSSALFDLLGVPPVAGRVFSSEEDVNGDRVVVINYGLWQRQYSGVRVCT